MGYAKSDHHFALIKVFFEVYTELHSRAEDEFKLLLMD